jgi:hypothetical protein
MTLEVEPLENHIHVLCRHPRCDGRAAKWTFPQTKHLPDGPLVSCSVHVARFLEIVMRYHAIKVPINVGRKNRAA